MTDKAQDKSRTHRHNRRFIICAITLSMLIATVAHIWSRSQLPNIEERLAAIEAARAIPDSENTAFLYDKLLQNPNALIKDQSELLGQDVVVTRTQIWTENDYPKIAVWIEEHQWLIDGLMNISQFETCRFPLIVEPYSKTHIKRLSTMRRWAFLLSQAANNNVGEGKIDDAIEKCQCLIQIGKHLRQQSRLIEYLGGMSIESQGIRITTSFLAEYDASENHFRRIESFQVQTHDDWPNVLDRIRPIEEIAEQKYKRQLSLFDRFKYESGLGQYKGWKDPYEISRGIYFRMLVNQRGMHIMVALRRYKNEHGYWPVTLDNIKPWLAEEILTDPHNNGPFVYKLTDDGFVLYSKGKNNIDEGGRNKDGADDWRIWLPKGLKSIADITNNKQ